MQESIFIEPFNLVFYDICGYEKVVSLMEELSTPLHLKLTDIFVISLLSFGLNTCQEVLDDCFSISERSLIRTILNSQQSGFVVSLEDILDHKSHLVIDGDLFTQ